MARMDHQPIWCDANLLLVAIEEAACCVLLGVRKRCRHRESNRATPDISIVAGFDVAGRPVLRPDLQYGHP